MSAGDVVARAAYALGRVARGATTAVSVPYRAIAGAGTRAARWGRPPVPRRPRRSRVDEVFAPVGELPPEVVAVGGPELVAALTHPDPAMRVIAVEVAGDLPGPRATPIINAALLDPAPAVRGAAAVAASRAQAHGAVFALIFAIDDGDAEVRVTAAMALEELTGMRLDISRLDDPAYRRAKRAELERGWKRRRRDQLAAEDQT